MFSVNIFIRVCQEWRFKNLLIRGLRLLVGNLEGRIILDVVNGLVYVKGKYPENLVFIFIRSVSGMGG